MQVVVVLSFIVTRMLLEQESIALTGPRWLIAPAICIYLAVAAGLARLRTVLSLRALAGQQSLPPKLVRRHNILAILGQVWLVVGLAGVSIAGLGQWARHETPLAKIPLLVQLTVWAPFVAAVLVTWILDHPFHLATHRLLADRDAAAGRHARAPWSRGEYVAYNTRHHLLLIAVPVCLIILAIDVLDLYVLPLAPADHADWVMGVGTVLAAGTVFLIAPVLIVRIWRTGHMPDGPLRRRLEEICRTMRIKYRDILIWKSGGLIANAGVMGLAAPVRYILLSDALLAWGDERQVEAVFAHEAGHVASRHIPYTMLFAVSSVTVCMSVAELLGWLLGANIWGTEVLGMALLALAWAFVFGWLSRRFERQSDVIGAWAISQRHSEGDGDDRPAADPDSVTCEGAAVFASALQHIAELNGIPPRQRNWRHGSIADRVSYILWLGAGPGTRRHIDRLVRRIKLALWVALLVGAGAIWMLG